MGVSARKTDSVPVGRRKTEMLGSDWEARLEEARARRATVLAAKTSPKPVTAEKPWETDQKLRVPNLIDESNADLKTPSPRAAAPAMPDLISEDLEHPAPVAVLVAEGPPASRPVPEEVFLKDVAPAKTGWSAWSVAAAAALLVGVPVVGYAVLSGDNGLPQGSAEVSDPGAAPEAQTGTGSAPLGAETAAVAPDAIGTLAPPVASPQDVSPVDAAQVVAPAPSFDANPATDAAPELAALAPDARPASRSAPEVPPAALDQTPRPVLPQPLPLQSGLPVPASLSLAFRIPAPATPIGVAITEPGARGVPVAHGEAVALAQPLAAVLDLPDLPAPLPAPAALRDTPSSFEFPDRLLMARAGAGDLSQPTAPAANGGAPVYGAFPALSVPAGDTPLALPLLSLSIAPVSFSGIEPAVAPEAGASDTLDIAMLDGFTVGGAGLPELSAPATATDAPQIEAAEPPAPLSAFTGTVYFHAPGTVSSETLQSEAERIAVQTGLEIFVRPPVSFKISSSNVRYFHDEDREAAAEVAGQLSARLRDFTNFDPAPDEGTIEVWLSGEPVAAPAESASEPVAAAAPAAAQPSAPAPTPAPAATTTRRAPVKARPAPTPTFETKTITRTRRGGVSRIFGQ